MRISVRMTRTEQPAYSIKFSSALICAWKARACDNICWSMRRDLCNDQNGPWEVSGFPTDGFLPIVGGNDDTLSQAAIASSLHRIAVGSMPSAFNETRINTI